MDELTPGRALAAVLLCAALLLGACTGSESTAPTAGTVPTPPADGSVVLFTRTEGFRHPSIEPAVDALRGPLEDAGRAVVTTEDPDELVAALPDAAVVVFLSTTGDVLDADHEEALETWLRAGGGFAGVHAAADTEYGWPFYGELLGTWFDAHPPVGPGVVERTADAHPSTAMLPERWERVDEWYAFRDDPRDRTVLATLDGEPMVWAGSVDDGAVWYTAMGHTIESWQEAPFVAHVVAGIESVA